MTITWDTNVEFIIRTFVAVLFVSVKILALVGLALVGLAQVLKRSLPLIEFVPDSEGLGSE